jgi:hypothetical protein
MSGLRKPLNIVLYRLSYANRNGLICCHGNLEFQTVIDSSTQPRIDAIDAN